MNNLTENFASVYSRLDYYPYHGARKHNTFNVTIYDNVEYKTVLECTIENEDFDRAVEQVEALIKAFDVEPGHVRYLNGR